MAKRQEPLGNLRSMRGRVVSSLQEVANGEELVFSYRSINNETQHAFWHSRADRTGGGVHVTVSKRVVCDGQ